MQKRDKFGQFLNKTVTKKSARKVKKKVFVEKANKDACDYWDECTNPKNAKNRTVVKLEKTRIKGKNLNISLFDLQDMIQAEVAFQLKDRW
jgi:hypothetical protein